MWVGSVQRVRRSEGAGRLVDVRTHIGVRFAVIPLSGVAGAIHNRSHVKYTRKFRKLSTVIRTYLLNTERLRAFFRFFVGRCRQGVELLQNDPL